MWGNLCNSEEVFSAHKNSGLNLIAVPEEREDITGGNSLSCTTFTLFTLSSMSDSGSYFYQSSKYSSSTGIKSSPSGNNENVITLVWAGLQHLDLMCLQRLMNVIPDWFLFGNLPSLPLAFPPQHFPTPSLANPPLKAKKIKRSKP